MLSTTTFGVCLVVATLNASPKESFSNDALPLLETYCVDCHGTAVREGQVDFERLATADQALREPRLWRKSALRVSEGIMPPASVSQPTAAERERLATWMRSASEFVDPQAPVDPGPSLIRRLTREEYSATVRELMGVTFFSAADFVNFPDNEVAQGYENLAEALSVSQTLVDKLMLAADRVLEFWKSGLQEKADPALALHDWQQQQVRESVKRLLFVHPSETVSPRQAAQQILKQFLRKAYRRPPTDAEVERLLVVFDKLQASGESFELAAIGACKPAFVSPHFLLRMERERPAGETAGPVTDHELAVRLSYFLWGLPPDEPLGCLADDGTLSAAANYGPQVERMILHDRGRALIYRFASRWLQLSRLDRARPNTEFFPTFTHQLRGAMKQEVELFVDRLRKENGSVLDLLDADYTFANALLATHYGLEGVTGDEFRKVPLPAQTHRGGLLGMAAVHAMNAHTNRTSPTLRGKYVLEVLLGDAPPPPPANVSQLQEEDPKKPSAKSFRELLAQHASNKTCAGCHRKLDPLGFALEQFDAIGSWRPETGSGPVDARGQLPSGRVVNGYAELKDVIKSRQQDFVRHFAEELLSYALGRSILDTDEAVIQDVLRRAAQDDYRFRTFVAAVCDSPAFRWRRGVADPESQATSGKPN